MSPVASLKRSETKFDACKPFVGATSQGPKQFLHLAAAPASSPRLYVTQLNRYGGDPSVAGQQVDWPRQRQQLPHISPGPWISKAQQAQAQAAPAANPAAAGSNPATVPNLNAVPVRQAPAVPHVAPPQASPPQHAAAQPADGPPAPSPLRSAKKAPKRRAQAFTTQHECFAEKRQRLQADKEAREARYAARER
jgi:hypothetical protein